MEDCGLHEKYCSNETTTTKSTVCRQKNNQISGTSDRSNLLKHQLIELHNNRL